GHFVHAVAFSPDGSLLYASGTRTKAWNTKTGELLFDYEDGGIFAISKSGEHILSGNEKFALLDALTGTVLKQFPGHTRDSIISVLPGEKRTVSAAKNDTAGRPNTRSTLPVRPVLQVGHSLYPDRCAMSGQYLFSASRDPAIKIWNTKTRQL